MCSIRNEIGCYTDLIKARAFIFAREKVYSSHRWEDPRIIWESKYMKTQCFCLNLAVMLKKKPGAQKMYAYQQGNIYFSCLVVLIDFCVSEMIRNSWE